MTLTIRSFKQQLKTLGTILTLLVTISVTTDVEAQNVTRLITDHNGYWSSTGEGGVMPNNHHNLLAFTLGGVIYSTGANNTALATGLGAPAYANVIQADIRALPVGKIPGNTDVSYNYVAGALVDGNATMAILANVNTVTTAMALTDGIKGLDFGTAISNIPSSAVFTIPVGNFTISAIGDNIPDIVISQVGSPGNSDTFVFTDAAGVTIGNSKSLDFTNNSIYPKLGTPTLDLFIMPTGVAIATAVANGITGTAQSSRPIQIAAFKLSEFGITAGNVGAIAFLKITPGGGNDPAFFAYNGDSFSPRAVWKGSTSSNWNDPKNWLTEIVPNETIDAQIPAVISPNVYPISSTTTAIAKNLTIASGASVTLNGTGALNIAGVLTNSGTLNSIDGTVAFIGKVAQSIPASTFSTGVIKNLIVKNTAGVTMNSATSLTGILTVNDGGSFNTNDFLTLKSTALKTAVIAAVDGTVTGNMTIERYIPAKRAFRFLSSPTDGGTIRSNWMENGVDVAGLGTDITGAGGASNGFDISGSNNPSLFTYLNNNPGPGANWNAVTSANISQVAGVPYRMLVRGDRLVDQTNNNATATATTLRTKGTIKYGNVSVADLNPIADGFNLIGNPYQSPVNMYTLLNDASTIGIKNTFYTIWDPNVNTRGGYVTVTFDTNNENNDIVSVQDITAPTNSDVSRYLQPGQAAFVQTQVAGAPSLIFKENQKALSFSNVFRQANDGQSKIRFTLYTANALANGSSAADGFVVTFDESDENAANEFDAIKAVNQDESLGMMNSDKIYSFQRMAMPTISDVIPLSSVQYRTTDYTFRVAVDGLTDVTPMLLDKYTQSTTELVNDEVTDVNFTVDAAIAASTDANRFDIIFQETALGNNDNTFGNAIRLYPNPSATGNFFIALPSQFAGQASVEIVSLLGQKVYTQTTNATSNVLEIQPTSQLQAGVYFVNVTTAQGKATKKLIIK